MNTFFLTLHCGLHDIGIGGESEGEQVGICQLQTQPGASQSDWRTVKNHLGNLEELMYAVVSLYNFNLPCIEKWDHGKFSEHFKYS